MDATGADGTRTGTVATPPTERWSPNGSPSWRTAAALASI